MKEIIILVDKEGKMTLRTSGFTGEACLESTQHLEQILGLQDAEKELTSEYFIQPQAERQPIRQVGN